MSYKRVVKKKGKVYGPYIYESYRDENGKVQKRYLGKLEEKKNHLLLFILLGFLALALVIGGSYTTDVLLNKGQASEIIVDSVGAFFSTVVDGVTGLIVDGGDEESEEEEIVEGEEFTAEEEIEEAEEEVEELEEEIVEEEETEEINETVEVLENVTEEFNETLANETLVNETLTNETFVNETVEVNETVIPETNLTEEVNDSIIIIDLNETVEVNETIVINETVVLNVTIADSSTLQYKAVINRPVKWIKRVDVSGGNVSVELPKGAKNISILTGGEVDEAIEQMDDFENVVEESDREELVGGSLITGNVAFDISRGDGWLIRFWKWLVSFTISGNVILEEEISESIIVTENATIVEISDIVSGDIDVAIEYYTEAPQMNETNLSNGKRVVVHAPDGLNYTEILSYVMVDELRMKMNDSHLKLYWYASVEDAVALGYITPLQVPSEEGNAMEKIVEVVNVTEEVNETVVETNETIEVNETIIEENNVIEEVNETVEVVENETRGKAKKPKEEKNKTKEKNILLTGAVVFGAGKVSLTLEGEVAGLLNVSVALEGVQIEVDYVSYDFDGDGYVDYIEWIVPHLSVQTYEIIVITKAEHLDEDRIFVEDIYDDVKARDDNWSKVINDSEYVRVWFEENLTSVNDITLFARSVGFGSSEIEVYRGGDDVLVTKFENVSGEGWYKVYLTGLGEDSEEVFDLRIVNGGVEFDYIVDPSGTPGTINISFEDPTLDDGNSTGDDWIFVNVSAVANDSARNISTFIDFNNSLVAWWRMDEADGLGYASDYFGVFNSTANGGNAVQVDSGYFGKGWVFDGDGDYIDLPDVIDYASTEISLSAWFNASDKSVAAMTQLAGESQAVGGFTLGVNNGSGYLYFGIIESSVEYVAVYDNANIGLNEWHHLMGVFDGGGTSVELYLDGVLVDSTTGPSSVSEVLSDFSIGYDDGLGVSIGGSKNSFNGTIDDVMIFNRSLSAEEIARLYANKSSEYLEVNYTGLTEASYSFIAYAQDTDANVNETETRTVTYSTAAPIINITYPVNGTDYPDYVTALNYTVNVADYCWYSIDDGVTNYTAVSAGTNWTGLNGNSSLGSNTWVLWCNNSLGYENSTNVTFVVEDVAPVISYDGTSDNNSDVKTVSNIFVNVSSSEAIGNVSTFIDFDNSLVAWWRMDDVNQTGVGAEVYDYLGNYNGTAGGDAVQNASGYMGKSFDFDGVNDYINITDPSAVNITTDKVAFSVWIKPNFLSDVAPPGKVIFDKGAKLRVVFNAGIDDFRFLIDTGTGVSCDTQGLSWNIGEWHHFAGSYNGSNMMIYWDGKLNNTCAQTGNIVTSTKNFYIGNDDTLFSDFNGSIDDLMIFNRSLSAEEIVGLYANKSSEYLEVNYTDLLNGDYTFKAYAQDTAGNVNDSLDIRTVTIDTPFPVVSMTYPVEGITYANYVTALNYTVDDAESCWYSIDDGVTNYTAVSAGTNWTGLNGNSSLGSNTWTLFCINSFSNINSTNVTFTVDDVAPAISYDATTDADGVDKAVDNIFVNVSASDGVGNISTFIDFDGSLVSWWRMDDYTLIGSGSAAFDYNNALFVYEDLVPSPILVDSNGVYKIKFTSGDAIGREFTIIDAANLLFGGLDGIYLSGYTGTSDFGSMGDAAEGDTFDIFYDTGEIEDYMGRNNGSVVNTSSQTDEGYFGKGWEFDGDGSHINLGSDSSISFDASEQYTYSAWFKIASGGEGIMPILSNERTDLENGWVLYWYNVSSSVYFGGISAGRWINTGGGVQVNIWYHIAVTYDNGVVEIFLDGVSKDSDTILFADNTEDFLIGYWRYESDSFNGTIDDVMIFNRSLSALEIRGLYANKSSEYLEINYTSLADGTHTFKAYSQDMAGNVNDSLDTWTVTTDITAPIITMITPLNNSNWGTNSITFNASINEPIDWCGLSIDGGSNVSMDLNDSLTGANYTNTSIPDGSHTYIVSCNDSMSNLGNSGSYAFLVDSITPNISFEPPTLYDGAFTSNDWLFANVSASGTYNISTFIDFDNSLVGWWRMDDSNGSANSVVDYLGRNNGTAEGNATQTDVGYFGKGWEFDGVDDVINISDDSSLKFGANQDFSISVWFKNDGFTSERIVTKGNSVARYRLFINSNGHLQGNANDGINNYASEGTPIVNDNLWHHGVVVFDRDGNGTVYVDGVFSSTNDMSAVGDTDNTNPLEIGAGSGASYFNGTIDDVMIFNRSLSALEVRGLYANKSSEYLEINYTSLIGGAHTFNAYSQSIGGNVNSTGLRTMTIDMIVPIISIVYPVNGEIYNVNVTEFNYSVDSAESCWYSVDGGVINSSSVGAGTNFTGLSGVDGSNTWTLYCNDSAGNENSTSVTFYSTYLSACGSLGQANQVYTLYADINATGSCFNITASNVTLDGNGFDVLGDGLAGFYGVHTNADSDLVNLTVRDFGNIGNFSRGVYFDRVNDSLIVNNTMSSQVAQTTYAIYLEDSSSNVVENNSIGWNATGASVSYGVYFYASSGSYANNVTRNNLSVSSASGNGYGLYLNNVNSTRSSLNRINATASSALAADVYLESGSDGNIFDDNVLQGGDYAVYVDGSDSNNFSSNNVTGTRVKNAVYVDGSDSNRFVSNNISDGSTLAAFNVSSGPNDFINNSVGGSSVDYYVADGAVGEYGFIGNSLEINDLSFGNLRFLNESLYASGDDLSVVIAITRANVFVNSSLDAGFNTTANITLTGLTGIADLAEAIVDFNDNGTFKDCPLDICTTLYWNGTSDVFVFNVTRFTSYSAEEFNTAPNDPVVYLNTSGGKNISSEDLICTVLVDDPDGDVLNVSFDWYMNGTLNRSVLYVDQPNNANLSDIVSSGNTTKHQNWSCSVLFTDYQDNSSLVSSLNLTILNDVPVVTLTSPADGSSTTDRTPTFNWTVTDADEDSLTYEINISVYNSVQDTRHKVGLNILSFTPSSDLQFLYDHGDYYVWKVRADDGEVNGSWSDEWVVNISAEVGLLMLVDDIYFGNLVIGESNHTDGTGLVPFKIENNGTVFVNVSVNASSLWDNSGANNYMFKADNDSTESGSFNWLNSITTWLDMPLTAYVVAISELNYSDDSDSAEIDINVTVPEGEDFGKKSSTIVFLTELAE